MIIGNENIQSSIAGTDFKIKASAKAFKILSNNLYRDKPLAICRELICNAIDSHTAAGKADVPVEVTVPSSLNPNLIVEDFGLGLSREEVKQIYTTYFESTKADSNELVGGLGLGSKSPFAYTQSFSVIARKDGIENTFVAFIGANGMPQITCLNTTTTDKCNGVRVEVPVARGDADTFRTALQKLQWFEVMPTVHGWGEPIMKQNPAYDKLQKNGFAFVATNDYVNLVYAVMGNVAYPVDPYQVANLRKELHTLSEYSVNSKLFIRFDIGELDITPGREDLSYDINTQQAILAAVERVRVTIFDTVVKISVSDISLDDKLAQLADAGINRQSCIFDIIRTHALRFKPSDDFTLVGRCSHIPNGQQKLISSTESLCPVGTNDLSFCSFYYNNKDVLFVEAADGHSIRHCIRAVMAIYNTRTVIEIPQMDAEQRKYFDNVIGKPIHLASDVKNAVKEYRKDNKTLTVPPTVKHADDRIVVNGNPLFLSEYTPDKLKFVTDEYYVEFYKTLYPSARIAKVSTIYRAKIERNGFEVLDCDRRRSYTEKESFQIENRLASSMTKNDYSRLIVDIVRSHLGSSTWGNWGRQYNEYLCWFNYTSLVDYFADKLIVDIPDNFDYNPILSLRHIMTVDSIPSTILLHVFEKYGNAVKEKIRQVTIDNPILYLLSSRNGTDDVQIMLDTLEKLKGK